MKFVPFDFFCANIYKFLHENITFELALYPRKMFYDHCSRLAHIEFVEIQTEQTKKILRIIKGLNDLYTKQHKTSVRSTWPSYL